MRADIDVLIVGAGPVGLTLANDLAARNVSLRILERLPEPNRNSRAHGLQSRTLEALDRLGLAEPILAAAQTPQPPFLIFSGKKVVARIDFTSFIHEPYPFTVVIWQQRIERVLEQALLQRGYTVERSTRLVKFKMDTDGVTAEVERDGTPDTVRAKWIVGCDGGHSTVRETLGLKMEGITLPGRFWLGEFDLDWRKPRDTIYEWWHRGGMASAVFIDFTNKWHLFVESNKVPKGTPDLPQMELLFREHTGEQDAVLSNPSWIGALIINQRMPNRFIVDRALLAGDAAHVHSGAGGQGMNTGIQDALNLGWKLALVVSGRASASLLQTYESERLPNARNVLRYTQRYHRIQLPQSAGERWIATTFFRALQKIRPLGYAVARNVGMLNVNYRDSSLARQKSSNGTSDTQAGWHVPDVPCRLDGHAIRLFEIVRGTQANVLLFAGMKPSWQTLKALKTVAQSLWHLAPDLRVFYVFATEADAADFGGASGNNITDGGQNLQTAFGTRGPEIIYVRPDGYIGFRSDQLDCVGLLEYLRLIYAMAEESAENVSEARSRKQLISS
jgi:2-polyprenyl-6-methoxyphenol hydroxylase-like FAD-dependent oxidoreductase